MLSLIYLDNCRICNCVILKFVLVTQPFNSQLHDVNTVDYIQMAESAVLAVCS